MDEIISYKMCAVKVRNAKLRNYLKKKLSWLKDENYYDPDDETDRLVK